MLLARRWSHCFGGFGTMAGIDGSALPLSAVE